MHIKGELHGPGSNYGRIKVVKKEVSATDILTSYNTILASSYLLACFQYMQLLTWMTKILLCHLYGSEHCLL